jgi:hypothetical protein
MSTIRTRIWNRQPLLALRSKGLCSTQFGYTTEYSMSITSLPFQLRNFPMLDSAPTVRITYKNISIIGKQGDYHQ